MMTTTTSCKTQKQTTNLQYDRQVITDSISQKSTNLRDNSITDITITEYLPAERSVPSLPAKRSVSEQKPTIKRITQIHHQANIQSLTTDTITKREQSEQQTTITQQNKSSPDKPSQILAIAISTIILLIIVVIFILILKR